MYLLAKVQEGGDGNYGFNSAIFSLRSGSAIERENGAAEEEGVVAGRLLLYRSRISSTLLDLRSRRGIRSQDLDQFQ